MLMKQPIRDHEAFFDQDLIALLDEHYKWELLTQDASFDTHYHSLREALNFAGTMAGKGLQPHAVSRLDGTIFIDQAQLRRLLDQLGLTATAALIN